MKNITIAINNNYFSLTLIYSYILWNNYICHELYHPACLQVCIIYRPLLRGCSASLKHACSSAQPRGVKLFLTTLIAP